MNTHNRFLQRRIELGLAPKEVALRIEKTEQFIGQLERGEKDPSVNTLVRLCALYKVSADWLLGFTENKMPNNADYNEQVQRLIELAKGLPAFRHTFAITFLRNGGNVLELQRLLGHEKMDTLRIYVELAQLDLANAQAAASPADHWGL